MEGKEAGSGGKKVDCEIVSTKASAKPIVISGAGMALQSCPAVRWEGQDLLQPGINQSMAETISGRPCGLGRGNLLVESILERTDPRRLRK